MTERKRTYISAQQTVQHPLQQHLAISLIELDFGSIFELEGEIPRVECRAGW